MIFIEGWLDTLLERVRFLHLLIDVESVIRETPALSSCEFLACWTFCDFYNKGLFF